MQEPVAERPLEGLRVVELGERVSAPWASRYLALLGADVIKVEPREGDPSRRRGPFREDRPDLEASGLFMYLNVEKRGVTLELARPGAAEILKALVGSADVVIENLGQPRLAGQGVGFDDLRGVSDDLIVAALSPFGLTGPRAGDQATSLGIFHSGGEGFTMPGGLGWTLYSDREPIQGPQLAAHYDAGSMAAIAILVAVLGHEAGEPHLGAELLDLSEQEAQFGLNRMEMQRFPTRGFEETRATRALAVGDIVQASDGFVAVDPLSHHMWRGLGVAMEREDLLNDERFVDWPTLVKHGAEATGYIHEWAIGHDKDYVYHTAQRHGCAAGVIRGPRDLLEAEQLRARAFFAEIGDTGLEVPTAPFRLSETAVPAETGAATPLRAAPRLGEHNVEVYGQALGWTAADCSWHHRAGLI